MAENLEKNPYLHNCMIEAEKIPLEDLYEKANKHGQKIFPNIITYSVFLNNLTEVMRKDVNVLKILYQTWEKEVKSPNIYRVASTSIIIKYHSLRIPLTQSIKSIEQGKVEPGFGSYCLPINILEATLVDWFSGNTDNATSGWILATNRPGGKNSLKNGAGPTTISDDGQAIQMRSPLPKEWADLYQIWNSSFLTNIADFPHWIVKLLIPQVSGYQKTPEEYMYNRILALYSHLNYQLSQYLLNPNYRYDIDWSNEALTKCFSKVSKESALHYEESVQKTSN